MSRESEKGVIGCLLLDNETIAGVSTRLTPEMFTDSLYKDTYSEYLKAFNAQEKTDEATIRWLLENKYTVETVTKELMGCIDSVPTSTMMESYVKATISDYRARKVNEILKQNKTKGSSVEEDTRRIINELESLFQEETKARTAADMTDLASQYFVDRPEGVELGISRLDGIIGGLEGGDTIVIGARPAVGKSALTLQIASNIIKKGFSVCFYNMEMNEKQIYERLISNIGGIELARLRNALSYTGDEKERFERANKILSEKYRKLTIRTGARTTSQIRAECIMEHYDVIIIDYLQLIIPEGTYKGNRFAEVGEISRKIKNLAQEVDVPIIALSQLNRVSEAKETKEPTMAELRESGNVEQDASIVLLMWNLDKDHKEKGLKVEKNRQGKIGMVRLEFDGARMEFKEISDDEDNPFI